MLEEVYKARQEKKKAKNAIKQKKCKHKHISYAYGYYFCQDCWLSELDKTTSDYYKSLGVKADD